MTRARIPLFSMLVLAAALADDGPSRQMREGGEESAPPPPADAGVQSKPSAGCERPSKRRQRRLRGKAKAARKTGGV